MKETMSILGVPVMDRSQFMRTEEDIGEWWASRLEQSILEAGKEEKKLAEERGDYHQGIPAITVIVDGGWSKRSHKHSYNAKSGVAITIGQATGKLLHNKYCTACAQGVSQTHTSATRTGVVRRQKWRQILSWMDLRRQNRPMAYATFDLLVMAIVLYTPRFYYKFQYGVAR